MAHLNRSFSNVGLLKNGYNLERPEEPNKRPDFVLVYTNDDGDPKNRLWRKCYEKNLIRRGLILQDVPSQKDADTKRFVKVYAPIEVLFQKAEDMHFQMQIIEEHEDRRSPKKTASSGGGIWEKLKNLDPFTLSSAENDPKRTTRTTTTFSEAHKEAFESKNGRYFDNAQRSRMVHRILQLTSFEKDEEVGSRAYEEEEQEEEDDDNSRAGEHGIHELYHKGVYEAYPLHDGPSSHSAQYYQESSENAQHDSENDRARLRNVWASFSPSAMFKYQPLDAIRKYYGVRVSFYFAWLGTYNCFLVPAALMGVLCFLYAFATMKDFIPSQEICDQSNEKLFYMCPQCDSHCSYYSLTSTCVYSKIARLFDNEATVFFSIFMSIWATLFLKYWKRKEAALAFHWDVFDLLKEYEPLRPQFVTNGQNTKKPNPVTNMPEPFIPRKTRIGRGVGVFGIICCLLVMVIGTLVGIIVYRASVLAVLYAHSRQDVRENAKLVTSFTAASINLLAIQCLTHVYNKIAKWLTNWENPRTVSAFNNSFTWKMYVFEFVNTYSSLFYVAFFQSSLINGNPVKYNRISRNRIEECHPSGCLIDVCIQLFVIMVGKQFLRFFLEFVCPSIRKLWNNRIDYEDLPQWETDYSLNPEIEFRMFHEYLDMVIQFGFVTMFVASFPLAPLFALINNIVEIRSDAMNFVVNCRRRVAEQVRNIGVWFQILEALTKISVVVNSFVIAFTTEFIPRLVYYYGYSPDRSLRGYVDNSLTYINISDLEQSSLPSNPYKNLNFTLPYCRFKEYVEPRKPYDTSKQFLHVMLARMIFVIVFQCFVFLIKDALSWLVPDVPESLQTKISRKMHVAHMCVRKSAVDALKDASAKRLKRQLENQGNHETHQRSTTRATDSKSSTSFLAGMKESTTRLLKRVSENINNQGTLRRSETDGETSDRPLHSGSNGKPSVATVHYELNTMC